MAGGAMMRGGRMTNVARRTKANDSGIFKKIEGPNGTKIDMAELERASVRGLQGMCPAAFTKGFICVQQLEIFDPANRIAGKKLLAEPEAEKLCKMHPDRVVSVLLIQGGAGAEALGASPSLVVVPGYKKDAVEYWG